MTSFRVSQSSGVPIYKQLVSQVEFMIGAGQIKDGDRLPSSRMLAASLKINRNTVARAYRELRDQGYVDSRRRSGMVVTNSEAARESAFVRRRARETLSKAAQSCVTLGLSAADISSLAYHFSLQAERLEVRVAFVECNAERANYFAEALSSRVDVSVEPFVLGDFDPSRDLDVDLVLTTFFHLVEVRRLIPKRDKDVVAIVMAPHLQTLVELAKVPKGQSVGILYSTIDQAQTIRDSLMQAGLHDIHVLQDASRAASADIDVVVIPSEMPELAASLDGNVNVIEFGNVLDEASIRMVSEVIEDLRDRKASFVASA